MLCRSVNTWEVSRAIKQEFGVAYMVAAVGFENVSEAAVEGQRKIM